MNENDNIQATNNMDDKINIWMKIKNIYEMMKYHMHETKSSSIWFNNIHMGNYICVWFHPWTQFHWCQQSFIHFIN